MLDLDLVFWFGFWVFWVVVFLGFFEVDTVDFGFCISSLCLEQGACGGGASWRISFVVSKQHQLDHSRHFKCV